MYPSKQQQSDVKPKGKKSKLYQGGLLSPIAPIELKAGAEAS